MGFGAQMTGLLYSLYFCKQNDLTFNFLSSNLLCPNYRQSFFSRRRARKWSHYFASLKNTKDFHSQLMHSVQEEMINEPLVNFKLFKRGWGKLKSKLVKLKKKSVKPEGKLSETKEKLVESQEEGSILKSGLKRLFIDLALLFMKIFFRLAYKLNKDFSRKILGKLVDKIDAFYVRFSNRVEKAIGEDFGAALIFCQQESSKGMSYIYASMNKSLTEFWQINSQVYEKIKAKIDFFKKESLGREYAAINVRRGDKLIREDRKYEIEEYIKILTAKNKNGKIKTIFFSSDGYGPYLELKKKLPDYQVITFINEKRESYFQDEFLKLPVEEKEKKLMEYLTDVEITRHASMFIGSFNTNFYRLISFFKKNNHCYDVSGDEAEAKKKGLSW